MRTKLLKAFRRDCDFAASTIRARGTLGNMFVIHGHGGQVVPVMISGGTKEEGYRTVRLVAIAHDAEAVVSMAEAWTLPPSEAMPGAIPSESPHRIEVIAVQLVTLEEATASVREIIRDKAGRITGLGPERMPPERITPAANFSGLLASVIPPVRPDAAAQATARELLDHFAKTTPGSA